VASVSASHDLCRPGINRLVRLIVHPLLAISGGGAPASLETTVLLTVDETMDALRKAGQVQYQAPGAG
jgi:hypothetical protein